MKPLPLDPEPDPHGTVLILNDTINGAAKKLEDKWLARPLPVAKCFGRRTLYLAHLTTCPNRKTKRGRDSQS